MRRRIPSGPWLAEGRFASVQAEIGEHTWEDEFDPRRKAGAKSVAVRARLVSASAGRDWRGGHDQVPLRAHITRQKVTLSTCCYGALRMTFGQASRHLDKASK
jgi:hypothetical protein